jgi:hypothetical protein
MVANPPFNAAVDVVGVHYPCGYKKPALTGNSTANAIATGRPLWASENGSLEVDGRAMALIRSITRGYLDGRMTAYLNWPLVAAITPNLPFNTVLLAVAPSPWSGAYRLGKETWATAQVTQFVATASARCLADPKQSTVDGIQQDIRTCTGATNQQWTPPA